MALYRGLPYDLPLGIELYSEVEPSELRLDTLPVPSQETVTDHELRSEDDARSLLDSLAGETVPAGQAGPQAAGRLEAGRNKQNASSGRRRQNQQAKKKSDGDGKGGQGSAGNG